MFNEDKRAEIYKLTKSRGNIIQIQSYIIIHKSFPCHERLSNSNTKLVIVCNISVTMYVYVVSEKCITKDTNPHIKPRTLEFQIQIKIKPRAAPRFFVCFMFFLLLLREE